MVADIDDGFGLEPKSNDDEVVIIKGDEYSQVDEFSEQGDQSWDSDFCQLSYEDAYLSGGGSSEKPSDEDSGDIVVVRDEYSQESFVRDRSKPQKSNKSELSEALKSINKSSGRGRKKQLQTKPDSPLKKAVVEKAVDTSVFAEPTSVERVGDEVGKSGILSEVIVDKKTSLKPLKEKVIKGVNCDDEQVTKRKYDKEGKKNRVETIVRCVNDNFSDKEFTLSDIKEKIRADIEQWEASGVSNIDVELSVCVKAMGVEVVGQASRPAGQRGRPANIMKLIAKK